MKRPKLNKIFTRCPQCNVRLISLRLIRHLRTTCPETKRRKQSALESVKREERERTERNTLRSSGKVLCARCSTLYLKAQKCPECTRRESIARTHVFCGLCGGHYAAQIVSNHVLFDCREAPLSCVLCKMRFTRGQHHDHETPTEFAGVLKTKAVAATSVSGTMNDPRRAEFVPGKCHHCERRAMAGSTSCFYHGDK